MKLNAANFPEVNGIDKLKDLIEQPTPNDMFVVMGDVRRVYNYEPDSVEAERLPYVVVPNNFGGRWIAVDSDELTISNDLEKLACGDLVVTGTPQTQLNGVYFSWAFGSQIQTQFLPDSFVVMDATIETDGLAQVFVQNNTLPAQFNTLAEICTWINTELQNYGSTFRCDNFGSDTDIWLTDTNGDVIPDGSPLASNLGNILLSISGNSIGTFIGGNNPKPNEYIGTSIGGNFEYKEYCLCDQVKTIEDGVYEATDKFLAVSAGVAQDVQGYIHDGVDAGDGFIEFTFISGNYRLIMDVNGSQVGFVTNFYPTWNALISELNTFSTYQFAGTSVNNLYVVGSNGSPLPDTISLDIRNDDIGWHIIKGWRPTTINIQLGGGCKLVELPSTPEFAQTVYFNATTPLTATIFDLNNPPVTNDPSLQSNTSNLYIGTDGSTWTYNAATSTYNTYIVQPATEWYLAGTSTDAGSNKTGAINRTGSLGLGLPTVQTPTSLLFVNGAFGTVNLVVTATTAIGANMHKIICTNGASNITLTLPNALTCVGREYVISRGAGSTGSITIAVTGANVVQALAGTTGATTSIGAHSAAGLGLSHQFTAVNIGGIGTWIRI